LKKKNLTERETAGGRRGATKKHSACGREHVSDLTTRIEKMHKRDVSVAWAFVIGLWLSIIFVAIATWSLAPSGQARIVLLIGGAIILILNTAAIMAMLKHYREDRDFMYGLDIKFLDAARARKG
jgi:hypothetical protein